MAWTFTDNMSYKNRRKSVIEQKAFVDLVEKYRMIRGWSTSELSEKALGCRSAYYYYRNGAGNMTASTMANIATALGKNLVITLEDKIS